jgi:hypothetical protein
MSDHDTLERNVKNREWLIGRIRAEIVGPDPVGPSEVDPNPETSMEFADYAEMRKPRTTVEGEEVLWQDPPVKRYGAGILYPSQTPRAAHDAENDSDLISGSTEINSDPESAFSDKEADRNERTFANSSKEVDPSEEFEINGANDYLPSSMGLSFLADVSAESKGFYVELVSSARYGDSDSSIHRSPCGIYSKKNCFLTAKDRDPNEPQEPKGSIYCRQSVVDEERLTPKVFFDTSGIVRERLIEKKTFPILPYIQVLLVSRPWKGTTDKRLITVSIINRRTGDGDASEQALFQAGFRIVGSGNTSWIMPYPEYSDMQVGAADVETQIARLNYRRFKTFAIGHGCAADWFGSPQDAVSEIWSDVMPVYEMPTTTPELEIETQNGETKKLRIDMRDLAGISKKENRFADVKTLIKEYDRWKDELSRRAQTDDDLRNERITAQIIERIEHVSQRIQTGFALVEDGDPDVRRAFELANEAMFIAQTRGAINLRTPSWEGTSNRDIDGNWVFDKPYQPFDYNRPYENIGYWRPFQIAFLLMSLCGLANDDHPEREEVDLIWFPTGGGKTEAYLGVIAYLLFLKRLRGEESSGVTVLMRYTLRLLTAQQFERAAILFCAMETLRKQKAGLGDKPFTLGLWVGSAASPNKRDDALRKLTQLKSNAKDNPFVLRRCPWCSSKFGVFEKKWTEQTARRKPRASKEVLGYVKDAARGTVLFQCPDKLCEFSSQQTDFMDTKGSNVYLPVCVIDEDLQASPPHLLISTVDKFALLAWKPELRTFFGRDEHSGKQISPPPSLIIQDELHLISGPLGSIVGAYETILDDFCTEKAGEILKKPKIIASTATISRAEQQVRHLYARENTTLFPPPGFDANSSFFAEESRDEEKNLRPGRIYVGVMAPGHFSLQTTEARVFANLLQWPNSSVLSAEEKDPWWTLLCFFNSLRELGSASTLLLADAREYLRVISDRHNSCDSDELLQIRSPFVEELTSRILSDEISDKLLQLGQPYRDMPEDDTQWDWDKRPVDVCLASSIIEVGVDVPRLSLMAVVGQPKTTAQYIQVTSRIGRKQDRPGLVFTLYGAGKSRDRSHYEKFRSYHQKVYSFVEPTSVTPFSIPVIERTLHALLVTYIRHNTELTAGAQSPSPIPFQLRPNLRDDFEKLLLERVEQVDPDQTEYLRQQIHKRFDEWERWRNSGYGAYSMIDEDPQLMHVAGQMPPDRWKDRSWPTLLSMRGIDASCEAEVTQRFNGVTGNEQ